METAGNQIDSNRKFLEIMVRLCQYVLMRRVPIAWVMRMCSVASTKRSKNQNPGLNLTIRRPDFLWSVVSVQWSHSLFRCGLLFQQATIGNIPFYFERI